MRRVTFAVGIVLLAATCASADVTDVGANGFDVTIVATIQAARHEVYRKIVHSVGEWWSPDHTFSGDPHNLSIEDKPMGCFCEKLPNGGGVRHMEVLTVMPDKTLVLAGALGPLQSLAVTANMRIALEAGGGGTTLTLTYAVGGYLPNGMNTWAGTLDRVLTEQVKRLKNYVERGDPGAEPK